MDDIKSFLTAPYLYLISIGVAALVGVWWVRMTPYTGNLTLVAGVIAIVLGAFFHPWIAAQPILVRLFWALAVLSILSLIVYYSLWLSSVSAISVSPQTINLYAPAGANIHQRIFVHNTSDLAYSVWIKVEIKSQEVKESDIDIRSQEGLMLGDNNTDPLDQMDALLVSVPHPETNSRSFIVWRIGPHETKEYNFSRKEMVLSESQKHEAFLSVEKLSSELFHVESYPGPHIPSPGFRDLPRIGIKVTLTNFFVGGRPVIKILWKNTGGKTAVQTSGILVLHENPDPPHRFEDALMRGAKIDIGDLAPGKVFETSLSKTEILTQQEPFDKLKRGISKIFVLGSAKYKDAEGRAYEIKFCGQFDFPTERFLRCQNPPI